MPLHYAATVALFAAIAVAVAVAADAAEADETSATAAQPRPSAYPDSIWVDLSKVREVSVPDARAFDIDTPNGNTHRVLVFPTASRNVHMEALKQLKLKCGRWRPISALPKADANAYTCHSDHRVADKHLEAFMAEYAEVLSAGLNISDCRTREDMEIGQAGRVFSTVLNDAMAPDAWHPDGCAAMERPDETEFFTVLTYPMPHWDGDPSRGGQIEFTAQECGAAAEGDTSSAEPPVLRVYPNFNQVIVFSGPLLHRATHPARQSASGQRYGPPPTATEEMRTRFPPDAAWRYSAVMQVVCRDTPYPPPTALHTFLVASVDAVAAGVRWLRDQWNAASAPDASQPDTPAHASVAADVAAAAPVASDADADATGDSASAASSRRRDADEL